MCMKKAVGSIGFALLTKFSSIFKMSFIVGSQMIWLSGPAVLAPLAGAFGGVLGSAIVFVARLALHFLMFKTISLSFLVFCVPGFFASLYWATRSAVIRVIVPIACMGLFIAHPVGNQAFVYSLYWLLPVVLYVSGNRSLFGQALGATFVAHAVGSVIWLYTVPMTAALWLGLIPVVACERLLFAVLMVGAYRVIEGAMGIVGSRIALSYTSREA